MCGICDPIDFTGMFIQSEPTFMRDKDDLTTLNGFPHQPAREVIRIETRKREAPLVSPAEKLVIFAERR